VQIEILASSGMKILCSTCFCIVYDIDETSLGHATSWPQDDLTIEHFQALSDHGKCHRCRQQY
jgi:hypothetical protein